MVSCFIESSLCSTCLRIFSFFYSNKQIYDIVHIINETKIQLAIFNKVSITTKCRKYDESTYVSPTLLEQIYSNGIFGTNNRIKITYIENEKKKTGEFLLNLSISFIWHRHVYYNNY